MLDALGKIVLKLDGEVSEIDVSAFEIGVYLIQIKTTKERYVVSRLIKKGLEETFLSIKNPDSH